MLVVSRDEILRLGNDAQAFLGSACLQVSCRQHAQISDLVPADAQGEPLSGTLAHQSQPRLSGFFLSHHPASQDQAAQPEVMQAVLIGEPDDRIGMPPDRRRIAKKLCKSSAAVNSDMS